MKKGMYIATQGMYVLHCIYMYVQYESQKKCPYYSVVTYVLIRVDTVGGSYGFYFSSQCKYCCSNYLGSYSEYRVTKDSSSRR